MTLTEHNKKQQLSVEDVIQNMGPAMATSFLEVMALFGANVHASWVLLFGGAYGLLGLYMATKQNKLNSFVEWINKNPEHFSKEIIGTQAFQDGFYQTLQAYLNSRTTEKEEAVKRVFLGFASSEDKERFELERYYFVINTISAESLEYLGFINEVIIPTYRERLEKERIDIIEWVDRKFENPYPLSKDIQKWIHENYNPNSPTVKKRWGYQGDDIDLAERIWAEERPYVTQYEQSMAEFVGLGLFRLIVDGGGGVGGGAHANFSPTIFGWNFLKRVSSKSYSDLFCSNL